MADFAKTQRGVAKRLFTIALKQMRKTITKGSPNEVVQSRFQAVYKSWMDVMEKHASYLAVQYPDDAEPEATDEEWLQSVESEYDAAEHEYEKYLKSNVKIQSPSTEMTADVKKALRACKYEESTLVANIDNLRIVTFDDSAATQTIKDAQNDIKTQLDRYRNAQRDYVMLLSDDSTVDDEMKSMKAIQTLCAEVNIEAGKAIESRTSVQEVKRSISSNGVELKLERMKMPVFSGQIREYPSFKVDFERQVMPSVKSNEAAAYVLKSCLKGEPLEIVKNVDDDIKQMWRRLDERYGRSSKLTDAIMYDIKCLRNVAEGDGRRFTEFVNTIERSYRDLSRISMESEISNSTIVSLIEEKLPPSVKSLWCLEISDKDSTIDDKNKFPFLLEFLLKHKRAAEYGSNDLRSSKHTSGPEKLNHVQNMKEKKESPAISTGKRPPNANDDDQIPCWIHTNSQHDIRNCKVFMDKNPVERMELTNEHRACWSCLRLGHRKMYCTRLRECSREDCKKAHHPLLHNDGNDQDNSVKQNHLGSTASDEAQPDEQYDVNAPVLDQASEFKQGHLTDSASEKKLCLLQLMTLKAGSKVIRNINVMWDSGATVSMITFKKANDLELTGTKTKISIVKVGGEREVIESKLYEVPIYDMDGKVEHFKAFGIKQISSSIECTETDELAKTMQVDPEEISRPKGEIDMLVGFDYAGFHPERTRASGHLLLMKNKFGQCLSGTHRSIEERTQMLIQSANVSHVAVTIEDFYTNESLGVTCQPRCGSCKCGECPIGGKQYTLQQERELSMIESGLSLTDNRWTAQYPWKRNPAELPNNFSAAFAMLKSTERRLKKSPSQAELYSDQIKDMVQRGVARKLSEKEAKEYSGPKYYVSHHEVMKPDSESTPCRIVFNSSAKYNNHVLNDYWAKGPDLVNNLLGILLRFRENSIGVAGDIRKMYHTVKISELDQHTHRFLWREMIEDRKPDEYVITSVSFGDKPAGAIAALALRKTAELSANEYPEASNTITRNSYVDDIINSYDDTANARKVTTDMDIVLFRGGFEIKEWIMSKDSETSAVNVCHETSEEGKKQPKVLGNVWNPGRDTLEFITKLNFSDKKRKVRESPDLTAAEVPTKIPTILTKRMILSQVNGIYDPLGIASPFIVKAKMMLRVLNVNGLGWDDSISEKERAEWQRFFVDMFQMETISFPRSTKPANAIGKPKLVIFSDASEDAFGACVYVRWQCIDGAFESRLLLAKSRLAPLKKITVPRLELNGALLAARLKDFCLKETTMSFEKIYCIVDSEIVRAMIQKESYGFNTFAGVRIGEIQALTDKCDWYWIEGTLNIADIISRGCSPCDLGSESQWQKGPAFLRYDEDKWPIRSSYSGIELPDQVVMTAVQTSATPSIANLINIERFSSYMHLLRVTARVQAVFEGNASLKNMHNVPSRKAVHNAEQAWIHDAQTMLKEIVMPQTLLRLNATEVDGILVVGKRIETWEKHTYNQKNPILLHSNSRFAKLYAQYIHNSCHLGISAVAVKIRSKYWIIGLRRLLKSIQHQCTVCRKLDAKVQQQVMGRIPMERLSPAPAWSYTSLDFFGPYVLKGETNKRARSRGYGVIFNCLLSRAVHLDLATDYSTDGFLLVIRRFISIRGCPIKVWSDRGSQLRSADKTLREIIAGIDVKAITEFGASKSFDWVFTTPDAPWQNGCAESLIKSVKKALTIVVGDQVLSFSEMQTVLFESGDLVNGRPIGRHPTATDDGTYLSPNDLLLGRSSKEIPNMMFNNSKNIHIRHRFTQKIVNCFWKKWNESFFPSLVIQQKWHTAHRNVKVGDVVIVQDSNQIRGKWRLGRVTCAEPSLRDGFVRNIEVQYKNLDAKTFTTIERPVQKVIVLVPVDCEE